MPSLFGNVRCAEGRSLIRSTARSANALHNGSRLLPVTTMTRSSQRSPRHCATATGADERCRGPGSLSASSGECSRVRLRRVATRAGVLRKRLVFVVAAPPDARLVAPLAGAVEPLIHAPEAVQPARIGGIGVVDDAVLE